jgi:methylenetetrahydrofolate dehydrogenase (NADP+)/methenyltetrahydrofolate cyclohydrolase
MNAHIVDGTALAAEIREQIRIDTHDLLARGIKPGFAAILVGDDRASATYVSSKEKGCAKAGMHSETHHLPAATSQEELIALVRSLNGREDIDAILVQKPLPKHIDEGTVMNAIDPLKDVDGFHPVNVGKLMIGQEGLVPATPLGIIAILERYGIGIKGARAVIIGRSDIVGKPVSMLLLHRHATITICHSRTRDLAAVAREADILIAAIGRAAFVTPDFVKPGAAVIDVGINAVDDPSLVRDLYGDDAKRQADLAKKGYTLAGDVHPRAAEHAGLFTPVPGGVGPLTIAMVLQNCLTAAKLRRGLH